MAVHQERSVGVSDVTRALRKRSFSLRAVLAEFIGMTFFVFAGCGTAIFFSSTRVSKFATETEQGQLGDRAGPGIAAPANDNAAVINTVKAGFVDIVSLSGRGCRAVWRHGGGACAHTAAGSVAHGAPPPCGARAPSRLQRYGAPTAQPAACRPSGSQATIMTVNSSWGVLTAMAFGLSITVLAYGIGACLHAWPLCARRLPHARQRCAHAAAGAGRRWPHSSRSSPPPPLSTQAT